MGRCSRLLPDWRDGLDGRRALLLDFDETLLRVNSTHAYLDSLRPMIVAYAADRFVLFVFTLFTANQERHVFVYRDWVRVVFLSLLLPWSYPLWRWRNAALVAEIYANRSLITTMRDRSVRVEAVTTFGFGFIIRPVLDRLLPDAKLVAGSFLAGYRNRREGKLAMVRRELPGLDLTGCVLLTDSHNDRDLLEACGDGHIGDWKDTPINPFANVYLPFLYTTKVKRPGSGYMVRGVLLQDCVAVILSFAWFLPQPLIGAFGILLMQLALWMVYEFGYYDNDTIAAGEINGRVPENLDAFRGRMNLVPMIAWATIFSAAGVALLNVGMDAGGTVREALTWPDMLLDLATWLSFLTFGLLTFYSYNRGSGEARIFLYPVLQLVRLAGLALFLPLSVVGIAILGGFVLGRSFPYVVYRASGVRWGQFNRLLVLMVFLLISLLLVAAMPPAARTSAMAIQFAVAAAWLVARSHPELLYLFRRLRRPAGP